MIHPIRSFDIEVNGKWLQVIYIIESPGGEVRYAAISDDGKLESAVPLSSITSFMVNK